MEAATQEDDQVVEAGEVNPTEAEVSTEIVRLWSEQRDQAAAARRTRDELQALRRSLGERLHEMKLLLVQTGRGGRWASYLRGHRIPRASADRYVRRHEQTLVPPEQKRLAEAISGPTDEDVRRLFQKLLPQMRKVLTTQDAAFTFVIQLIHSLPGIDGDVLDEGAIVFRPNEDSGPIPTGHYSRD